MSPAIDLVFETDIQPTVENANQLVIATPEQNMAAQNFFTALANLEKMIHEKFDQSCTDAHKAWKSAIALRASFLDPVEQARSALSRKCGAFVASEQRRVADEQRAAEAARQAEERKAREALEAKAEKAAASGKVEKAEALREQAQTVQVAPRYVAPAAPLKAAGVSTTTKWKGECVDILALVGWISNNPDYIGLVAANQPEINALARLVKGGKQIPGLKISQETTLANRGA